MPTLMSNFEVMASDKSALILPGLHEPGVALDGSALTAQAVVEWELSNNGVVFGSFVERSIMSEPIPLGTCITKN